MESGLRPAADQRQTSWRTGSDGSEIVGAPNSDRGGSSQMASYIYSGRMESTVLLEEPETRDPELLQEATAEAEKSRPGLTMATDRSRLDDGAARYAVVWKSGRS